MRLFALAAGLLIAAIIVPGGPDAGLVRAAARGTEVAAATGVARGTVVATRGVARGTAPVARTTGRGVVCVATLFHRCW
jgi:hypothetical protein